MESYSKEITRNYKEEETILDALYQIINNGNYAIMPTKKDVTVAWNLWHITRIEDIVINLLIKPTSQILDENWVSKLHTKIKDTGNAMSDDEIMSFSKEVSLSALQDYRKAVGIRTKEVVESLAYEDLFRKPTREELDRILKEGGLTTHPDSIWLRDFWGRKDVAQLLLMPITRHQLGHINDSFKLVQAADKRKDVYRK